MATLNGVSVPYDSSAFEDFARATSADEAAAALEPYGGQALLASSNPYSYADYLISTMEQAEEQQFDRSQASAERAMSFSAEEAQKDRDFQKMMSDTAVQRAMEDLRAAGVNPALAYANPASTPSGAMASGFQASAAMQQRSSQNISESEKLSKRERDSKIWSSVLGGIFGLLGKGIEAAGNSGKDVAKVIGFSAG